MPSPVGLSSGQACAVMVMMVWSFTLKQMLLDGIPEIHRSEGPMFHRLLFTYAATLTAICGFATVRIVRCRRQLSAAAPSQPEAAPPPWPRPSSETPQPSPTSSSHSPHSSPTRRSHSSPQRVDGARALDTARSSCTAVEQPPLPPPLLSQLQLASPLVEPHGPVLEQLQARVSLRTALSEFLGLLEQTFVCTPAGALQPGDRCAMRAAVPDSFGARASLTPSP